MPFNPSGAFVRLYRWVTDRDNDVRIDATRMDAETDGIVDAINAIVQQTQPFSGSIRGPAGTAATPGFSFGNDPDTGIFRPSADQLAVSVAGARRALFSATAITLDLPLAMGANKITGLAPATNPADAVRLDQVMAADAGLSAFAALSRSANTLPYATGANTWSTTALTAFARSLLDDASAPAALVTLGAAPAATSLSTTGNQGLAGNFTVTGAFSVSSNAEIGGVLSIRGAGTTNIRMANAANATRWAVLSDDTAVSRFRAYAAPGGSFQDYLLNGSTGVFTAAGFAGDGSALTSLSASELGSGTVPPARLPLADQSQAEAGANNATLMTPLRVSQAITSRIYTGSSAAESAFPVGHQVIAWAPGATRNQSAAIRVDSDNSGTYSTTGSGTLLAGTWRQRGNIAGSNNSLFERVV